MTPIALTIAGSDSSGGAGIQADLKTFSALEVYGASVITALTAQNTQGVQGVLPVPAAFVTRQIDSVFDDLTIGAVKIGMLGSAEIVDAVADALERHGAPNVILDPVMVATSGDRLISDETVGRMKDRLIPLALVLTPNLPEAAVLLGDDVARTEADMQDQGRRLLALGSRTVLLKGGHADGPDSVDLVVAEGRVGRLEAPRFPTRNTHGTGCTLSAAIAASLALGASLVEAVAIAKHYVSDAIATADKLKIGSGSGPVHHFHAWWGSAAGPNSQSSP